MAEVSFGEWLRRQRKAAGLTQEQLALQISCSTSALKKIEAEERRPSEQIVERLAAIYHIAQDERAHFLRFARGDWRFAPAGAIEDAPWRTSPASPRSNLPVPLTGFIGREKEVEEIVRLLTDHHLVELTGPGGMGKTRLAIEAANKLADKFKDGVKWVDLVGLNDNSLVAQAVAQAVSVHELPGRPLVDALVEQLRSKETLLVLDNCEHLILACAQLVDRLLGSCEHLKILATSRERLNVLGETTWTATALSLPESHGPFAAKTVGKFESIGLFADRAASVQHGFELVDQNANAVVEICRRLGGMPLAIELAAARATMMSVDEIAERLDNCFELLTAGSRVAPSRHQTLRATIDWSHELLTERERILFCRLAVFAGSFTLAAVQAICSHGMQSSETLDLLSRLIDKSLVMVEHASPTGETRYRLLETIRQYALEKLAATNELSAVRDEHLQFFVRLAKDVEPKLFSNRSGSWDRLYSDLNNFRAAMEWATSSGKAMAALQIAGSLIYFWFVHGLVGSEWRDRVEPALESPEGKKRTLARAKVLNGIGLLYWADLYPVNARAELEEALSIARELGDSWNIATALRNFGLHAAMEGSYQEAQVLLEQSLHIWQDMGPEGRMGSSWTLIFLGETAWHLGQPERARLLLQEANTSLREIGDHNFLAYSLRRLAQLEWSEHNYDDATALCKESLTFNREVHDLRGVIACLAGFADIAVGQGRFMRAARLMAAAEDQLALIGTRLLVPDRMEYERNLALLRDGLDEKKLIGFWEEGRAMTMEQTIKYAVENQE